MEWIHDHLAEGIDCGMKGWLVAFLLQYDERCRSLGIAPLGDRILELLPTGVNESWIWGQLQQFLIRLLAESKDRFRELFFQIAVRDRNALGRQLGPDGAMAHLLIEIKQSGGDSMVEDALASDEQSVRQLGITLFGLMRLDSLSTESMDKWTDNRTAMLIFQVQRDPSFDSNHTRFLFAISPRIENGHDELKSLFSDEMVYQMTNLPESCKGFISRRMEENPENVSETVKAALGRAERYLEKLTPCWRSAINSMDVAGYRHASNVLSARRSREMTRHSEASSPLMGMCRKSYLLYGGDGWRIYSGYGLGGINGTKQYSNSMEIPKFAFIDPEGDDIRRFNAIMMIRQLEREEQLREPAVHDES